MTGFRAALRSPLNVLMMRWRRTRLALAEADEEFVDAVLGAKTGSDECKAQLRTLRSALVDQIDKLGPTLVTPAGQQQLNDFLQSKAQEILGHRQILGDGRRIQGRSALCALPTP